MASGGEGERGRRCKHQTPSESPKAVGGSWRPRSGHLPPPPEHKGTIDDDSDNEDDDGDDELPLRV